VAFVIAAAAAVGAQQTPPPTPSQNPPQVTFRAGIDLVRVNVSVTDHDDRIVDDLTSDDFELKEEGKVQAIESFKFVRIDDEDRSADAIHEINSLAEQERQAAREDVRLMVVFIDDYHILPANALAMRDTLADFVRQISPRDLVAIMYPVMPVDALTFSRDHEAQASAIARFEGRKFDFFPKNQFDALCQLSPVQAQQALRDRLTSRTLKALMRHLSFLRDGPKTLLLVTEGLGERVPPYLATGSGGGRLLCNALPDADFPTLAEIALENNVEMYTMDSRGVESDEMDMRQRTPTEAATQRAQVARMQEQLRDLAFQTNGRAMVGTANYLPILRQMLSLTGSYYLLGSRLAAAKRDGRFHEISVRVKRDGVRVRARKGYLALDEEMYRKAMAPPPPAPPREVTDALATLAASSARRALRLWVCASKGEAGRANLTAVWSATPDGRTSAEVASVRLTALSTAGGRVFDGPAPAEPPNPGSGRVAFSAPPGSLRLRAVATMADGQVLDREQIDIAVPDFSAALTIGTPWIFRGRTARDLQVLESAASPLPTVDREFSRTERLLVRVPVYGPGGTVVVIRVLNATGQPILTLPAPTAMAADTWEAEVSLSTFAAADYLLDIQATAGEASARTLVALRITR
jgi:VWFA-related protein